MNDRNQRNLLFIRIFTGFISTVLVVIILKELDSILIPLFMSLLLYFLFHGIVQKMVAMKIPRFIALSFLLMFIFIIFYLFGLLIFTGATSFINKFPTYSTKITTMITNLLTQLKIPLESVNEYINNIDWKSTINTSNITSIISTTFGSFSSFIGNMVLVLLFLMFMLAGRNTLPLRVDRAFSKISSKRFSDIIYSMENHVQQYLIIKTFVSIITALIGGLILTVGRVDFVIFSALLIFVLNYIPNFGSIIATLFPILICFIQYGLSIRMLLVGGGLLLTQFVMGNIIEPKLTGKNLNLSPLVILISLIFWGWIWGVVGMILAVPLTSAIKIIMEHIEGLKPYSTIISSE